MSKAPTAAAGKGAPKATAPAPQSEGAAFLAQQQGTTELAAFVQTLMEQMQNRFQEMSDSIVGRIDEMGSRIDELERSINDLMQHAGVDDEQTHAAAAPPPKKK